MTLPHARRVLPVNSAHKPKPGRGSSSKKVSFKSLDIEPVPIVPMIPPMLDTIAAIEPPARSTRSTARNSKGKSTSTEATTKLVEFATLLQKPDVRNPVLQAANESYDMGIRFSGGVIVPSTSKDEDSLFIEPGPPSVPPSPSVPTAVSSDLGESESIATEVDQFLKDWLVALKPSQGRSIFAESRAFVDKFKDDTDPDTAAEMKLVKSAIAQSLQGCISNPGSKGEPTPRNAGTQSVLDDDNEGEVTELPKPPPGLVHTAVAMRNAMMDSLSISKSMNLANVGPLDEESVNYLQTLSSKLDKGPVSTVGSLAAVVNGNGSNNGSKRLQPWQIMGLKAWLNDHFQNPYPTTEEKKKLCEDLSLSKAQLANWFMNTRRRLWQPLANGSVVTVPSQFRGAASGITSSHLTDVGVLQCSVPNSRVSKKRASTGKPDTATNLAHNDSATIGDGAGDGTTVTTTTTTAEQPEQLLQLPLHYTDDAGHTTSDAGVSTEGPLSTQAHADVAGKRRRSAKKTA